MKTRLDELEPSLYQILVMCGDISAKHTKKLSKTTGASENHISTWGTRGIPFKYWDAVVVMSGFSVSQICTAQAVAMDADVKAVMKGYLQGR